jgi:hypothetical protein
MVVKFHESPAVKLEVAGEPLSRSASSRLTARASPNMPGYALILTTGVSRAVRC